MKILIFLLGIFLASNAYATTWYVATTGSDSNNCTAAQNPATPKLTITAGLSCASSAGGAGNTVQVADGTYNEVLVNLIPNGASGNPFTFKAANRGGAVINQTSLNTGIEIDNSGSWIIIDGFKIQGNGAGQGAIVFSTSDRSAIHDIIVQYVEATGHVGSAFQLSGTNITVQNNNVHNGGTNGLDHACYCDFVNGLIQNNEFSFYSGVGVHMFDGVGGTTMTNNTVRSNRIHDNSGAGLLASGINLYVYNNLIYGNASQGIEGTQGGQNVFIYENTIYNNSYGIQDTTLTNSVCQNNLLLTNTSGIQGCGTNANNIIDATASTYVNNAAGGDFTLKNTSPAINAGVTLGSPFNVDFIGTARPQQSAYDIGAYEFIPPPSGAPKGMVAFNGGPGVAINSCGSGASVSGNDSSGKVTVGSGTVTTCSVNFSGTYGKAPNCVAVLNIATVPFSVASTTSGFTISTGASNIAGDSINYLCVQTGKQ